MPAFRLVDRLRFGAGLLHALANVEPAGRKTGSIARRAATGPSSFLALVEREIWQRERQPYRALLEIAGWSRDRLAQSVVERGLEPTLERLADDGVLLEAGEIKGRKLLVRRGRVLRFSPLDLDSVRGPAVPLSTSGSSGPQTTNPIDLDGLLLQASYMPAMLEALSAHRLPLVLYYPAPSAAGIAHMLAFALAGAPPDAWFCHLRESTGRLFQWQAWLRALAAGARVRGVHLPLPRLAPIDRPEPLVRRLLRTAPAGAVVATFPGSALRTQAWAMAAGLRLPPLVWILGGEPVTPLKRRILEEQGHRVYPWYGTVDAGRIAVGCLEPKGTDDMHVLTDRFAAVSRTAPGAVGEPGDRRLLLTSLVPEVHKLLLNADIGDRGELQRRSCGCSFGRLGLTQHVHRVVSAQKLTLEGMTLPADRVRELAEELLPASCGGTPADFQLVEEEDGQGLTHLVVLVAPGIPADDGLVLETVKTVLRRTAGRAVQMAVLLESSGSVTVRRETPRLSRGGKLLGFQRAGGPSH